MQPYLRQNIRTCWGGQILTPPSSYLYSWELVLLNVKTLSVFLPGREFLWIEISLSLSFWYRSINLFTPGHNKIRIPVTFIKKILFPYLLFCYCISFILNTTRSIFRYCIVLYVEIFFNALRSMWKFSNTFSTKLILFVKKVATYHWMGADTVYADMKIL